MTEEKKSQLLKDKRVVEEINRHLWVESEKQGHDIGFEKAAEDWLENFSKAWMNYHLPKKKSSAIVSEETETVRSSETKTARARSKKS
jgi:hypothetical protein